MIEVLDTRFFMEHFFSTDPAVQEKTRGRIRDLRRRREGVVPLVVVAELVDQVCRRAGRREAELRGQAILSSGLEVRPMDPSTAVAAGILRCSHRRIPLADCILAAVSNQLGGRVVSDDPHFAAIRGTRTAWL